MMRTSKTPYKPGLCYVWPEYINHYGRFFKKLAQWDSEGLRLMDHQCIPATRAQVATLGIRAHQAHGLIDKDGGIAGKCEEDERWYDVLNSDDWGIRLLPPSGRLGLVRHQTTRGLAQVRFTALSVSGQSRYVGCVLRGLSLEDVKAWGTALGALERLRGRRPCRHHGHRQRRSSFASACYR